ncbi:MAG: hypothetical protein OER86_01250 [Phycisphaerae bacterium]|nr:hypothetical protein [Phycisphaerae bacterium]
MPVFPLGRSLVAVVVMVAAYAALAASVCAALGHGEQIMIAIAAAGVCGIAGALALLPVWALSRVSEDGAVRGFMFGVGVRMLLTLIGFAILLLATGWSRPAVGAWVGGGYLVMLASEVTVIRSFLGRMHPPEAAL